MSAISSTTRASIKGFLEGFIEALVNQYLQKRFDFFVLCRLLPDPQRFQYAIASFRCERFSLPNLIVIDRCCVIVSLRCNPRYFCLQLLHLFMPGSWWGSSQARTSPSSLLSISSNLCSNAEIRSRASAAGVFSTSSPNPSRSKLTAKSFRLEPSFLALV